jgi:putative membrane protein
VKRRNYLRVLIQLSWRMRGDILAYAIACILIFEYNNLFKPKTLSLLHGPGLSMLGIAVSIFVAFRNTQAINRWWEGRVLWGVITNEARHWRDSLQALLGPEAELAGSGLAQAKQRLLELQVLQVWLLNFELRNYWRSDARDAVDGLCHGLMVPVAITLQDSMKLRASGIGELHRTHAISEWGRDSLLRCTETMTNALGGIQRIRNTPLPPAYDVFIRLICWLFGLAVYLDFLAVGTPLAGLLLFLGFLTAERLGSYVEGPFDNDGSSFCLPMDWICINISRDLLGQGHPLSQLPSSNDPSRWS